MIPAEVEESVLDGESPCSHVSRLAQLKASVVSRGHPDIPVLAADTVVVCDGVIHGKPADLAEARHILRGLSGAWHEVLTGVALLRRIPALERCWVCRTHVRFRELSDRDIEHYVSLVNPLDKAGAYAIQEHGDLLVAEVRGLSSNVIGLPVEEVLEVLGDLDCS